MHRVRLDVAGAHRSTPDPDHGGLFQDLRAGLQPRLLPRDVHLGIQRPCLAAGSAARRHRDAGGVPRAAPPDVSRVDDHARPPDAAREAALLGLLPPLHPLRPATLHLHHPDFLPELSAGVLRGEVPHNLLHPRGDERKHRTPPIWDPRPPAPLLSDPAVPEAAGLPQHPMGVPRNAGVPDHPHLHHRRGPLLGTGVGRASPAGNALPQCLRLHHLHLPVPTADGGARRRCCGRTATPRRERRSGCGPWRSSGCTRGARRGVGGRRAGERPRGRR
mmetsp:Transcript_60702/g.144413  ORF Transcript_60702/g.144413 Transcript_60702/m.144413 type:complete len:275 (-) Transcript_60702:42-866(-)